MPRHNLILPNQTRQPGPKAFDQSRFAATALGLLFLGCIAGCGIRESRHGTLAQIGQLVEHEIAALETGDFARFQTTLCPNPTYPDHKFVRDYYFEPLLENDTVRAEYISLMRAGAMTPILEEGTRHILFEQHPTIENQAGLRVSAVQTEIGWCIQWENPR